MLCKYDMAHLMLKALLDTDFDYALNTNWGFWYAEDRLYIVHDFRKGAYYFIIADSPAQAVSQAMGRDG